MIVRDGFVPGLPCHLAASKTRAAFWFTDRRVVDAFHNCLRTHARAVVGKEACRQFDSIGACQLSSAAK